jgi:hypothetical protein
MGGTDLLIMDMGEFETPGINVTAALDADPAPTSATSVVAGASAGKPQAASAAAATPAGGEPQPRTPKGDAAARTPKAADGKGGRGGDDLSKPSLSAPSFTGRAAAEAALRLLQPSQSSLTGRGGGRPGRGAAARPARQLLRVYSVLPAGLAQRAKAWGSQLNVKDGWRQTDRGFFDAPGAEFAEGLGTSLPAIGGLEPERDVPPVTMVRGPLQPCCGSGVRVTPGTRSYASPSHLPPLPVGLLIAVACPLVRARINTHASTHPQAKPTHTHS